MFGERGREEGEKRGEEMEEGWTEWRSKKGKEGGGGRRREEEGGEARERGCVMLDTLVKNV